MIGMLSWALASGPVDPVESVESVESVDSGVDAFQEWVSAQGRVCDWGRSLHGIGSAVASRSA